MKLEQQERKLHLTAIDSLPSLPVSLQKIIEQIRQHHQEIKPSIAKKIVIEADVKIEDIMPWASFNHSPKDSYGRQLVFSDNFFEIMVMSWVSGDVSAIHDHGYTQWGAVQVFGAAEHAVFIIQNDLLLTLSRETLQSGTIMAVGNQLIHQMANISGEKFLSLHVYGVNNREFSYETVTADARIWNITEGVIQKTDSGVFFALPQDKINSSEPSPQADYPSWLRNTVEYLYRIRKAKQEKKETGLANLETTLIDELFHVKRWQELKAQIVSNVNSEGHIKNSNSWKILQKELIRAAQLQNDILEIEKKGEDSFFTYAKVYDEVIGKQCLSSFIAKYIQFFNDTYDRKLAESKIISIGCGTGIVEEFVAKHYNLKPDNLLGIDISPAMVQIASQKIEARVENILDIDKETDRWDICFSGLNVFQYLRQPDMETAIANTAKITKNGGYFLGDFITPDHIRWYPNVIATDNVISLRQPTLLEQNHNTFQQSKIINISKQSGTLRITDEGNHIRYLPSLWKVRYIFSKYFDRVDIFDAISLESLQPEDDTSPSTRYVVVARKS
ncbi:MAG: methyltransferase domain-containing protein [Cyanobacteria bacterium SBLK]|nr:methyltransferase domain-containing protein [Cyanobacteria bacterium SBLK]